jgi:hypothetical protein
MFAWAALMSHGISNTLQQLGTTHMPLCGHQSAAGDKEHTTWMSQLKQLVNACLHGQHQ